MKAIDSNLLVYASLANHPAMTACEQYIAAHPAWLTNIVNLVELHRVLIGVYGVSESDADAKFTDFRNAIVFEDLTGALASAALPLRHTHGIDFNDAVLLQTCHQRGVTVLATDDSKLAAAGAELGIVIENPIDTALRAQMKQWEDQNLPAKGLPRILMRIHRWIGQRDAALAADFYSATQGLSRLV
ncbi:MAG: type II toxin-antitoxin system VapC family toxin [Candidatus Tectomicrobia bacterium]|uniref:Ribonuclease VapC n=1 Tax=Tectimicrobiota bacterium TaxID=2528274 RepID=A0A932CPT6_UNCTE|nr:type II toxin-antitoxin system VapC family toxin [Candidatus Tectomicrobia bacterium]